MLRDISIHLTRTAYLYKIGVSYKKGVDQHKPGSFNLGFSMYVWTTSSTTRSLFNQRRWTSTKATQSCSHTESCTIRYAESQIKDRLTDELETLKKQTQQATSDASARIRITAYEQEISALKLRVEGLEGTPEGQNRQSSGGLSSKTEELSIQIQKAVEEMKDIKELFQNVGRIHVVGTCWFVPFYGAKMAQLNTYTNHYYMYVVIIIILLRLHVHLYTCM